MPSSKSLEKELALIDIGFACFEIPKFRGQEEEFTNWLSKVERVFACCILNDQEKFKVVISRLRGYALEWWEKYKYKRKKRGKCKIKTWDKLRGKLMDAFTPISYFHKHHFLPSKRSALNSSSKDILFNKGSPMSVCISNSTPLLCLEKPNSNKDEKILGEEPSSLVELPPIFDDYGEDETFELEEQEDCSCPSPLVPNHHLHKEIASVAHFDPCYDNFIVSLPPQLEPTLAKFVTLGEQVGNTSEGQPRGKKKKKEGNTMGVLKLFPCVGCVRTITMDIKEALSWVFILRRESTIPSFSCFKH